MIQPRGFQYSLFAFSILIAVAISAPAMVYAGQLLHEGGFDVDSLEVTVAADGSAVLAMPGAGKLIEPSAPELLRSDLTLLVPADLVVGDVEIVPLQTRLVDLPAPLREGGPLFTDRGDAIAVGRLTSDGAAFPSVWGEYGGTNVMRGYRLLSFTIYPARALGEKGDRRQLEVLERYEVRIKGETLPAGDIAIRKRQVPGERARMENFLRDICVNPGAISGYSRDPGEPVIAATAAFDPTQTPSMSGSRVSYLVITSAEMEPEFQRLADHRTALGMPAVVRTIEWIDENYRHGVDLQETIRHFIREAYEKWGIEYVLLGGDSDVLPPRLARSTFYPLNGETFIPSDLYFSCLDGNWNDNGDDVFGAAAGTIYTPGDDCDLINEVFLGRVPSSTAAEAGAWVDKALVYETQPAGTTYTGRALLAAEVLFWNEDDTEPTMDGADFAEALVDDIFEPLSDLEYIRLYESYAETDTNDVLLYPGSLPESRAAVVDSLNSGNFAILNQIGHGYFFNMSVGSGNITVTDADAGYNDGYPFLIYALNCASAAFDYSCVLERYVLDPDGGAVAAIGSVRETFPTLSNDFQYEFFNSLIVDGTSRLGELMMMSRLPFIGGAAINSVYRWTVLNYTLLGDPATPIWTGPVQGVDVTAPTALNAGDQFVPVTVNVGGAPFAGAEVCLALDGNAYAAAVTDGSGQVNLPFLPSVSGNAELTVSGTNIAVTGLSIPVSAGAAYIALDEALVIDDGSAGSIGNGNGLPEAGEVIAVQGTFRDTGGGGATGVVAALTVDSGGATVIDGASNVGSVPPSGAVEAADLFLIALADTIPDGRVLNLDADVVDGASGQYDSRLQITVCSPELEPIGLDWSDEGSGDGDHVLDDGEVVTLTVDLKNYGRGTADLATGVLRTNTPGVSLVDSVLSYSSIAAMESSGPIDQLSFSVADVSAGYDCWIVFTDNYDREFEHHFTLADPIPPTGMFTDSTLGVDTIALHWDPAAAESLRGYNVYRSTDEYGDYELVNQDLLDGSAYYADSGLGLLTRYYYKIATVDASLNEGYLSLSFSGSTAPAELGDYPLPFASEASGSLVVGDVDDDGVNEIVLGADEIYIWDAFGNEHIDGDNNAQSLGPITDLDLNFALSSLAMADLDGIPGMETVATEKLERKVHVFRPDGSELPGWPQSLKSAWNWPSPALGDIDGDQELEIVVLTNDGEIFAWNVDATEVADGDSDPTTNGLLILRPEAMWCWETTTPSLCDLDGDGACEIIIGTKFGWDSQNYLHAFHTDGTEAAGFPFATGTGGSILSSPAIADIDGDEVMEIVFSSEDDSLHVIRSDGTRFPGFPVGMISNTSSLGSPGSSPALGDFDEDGELEIVVVAVVDEANSFLYVYDTDFAGGTAGQPMPGWPVYLSGASESSPVVGDIDGDGSLDIVYGIGGTSSASPDALYAFDMNGGPIAGFPIFPGGPVRPTPTLCDLDRDNDIDIVYGGWDSQIHVWDMPFPFVPDLVPWPTFHANNRRDGILSGPDLTAVPDPTPSAVMMLAPNFPNPFNPVTTLRLYLPGDTGASVPLQLKIYDIQGRLVRTLHDGPAVTGWSDWSWDGRDDSGRRQSSGSYLLRARGLQEVQTRKMTLVK